MIKLNININPDDIPPSKTKYKQEVHDSLHEIAVLVPNHKEDNFINRLWGYFKQEIWKQQGYKCAFCEKSIVMDNAHLEHFRPKSKTHGEDNNFITSEAYWWLVYDHRNYMVSCPTCNTQKGNKFPIENERTRVTAKDMDGIIDLNDEGVLGDEIPCIINPRYKDPEPHLEYRYSPNPITPMAYIAEKDDTGKKTIKVLDLNRIRKNEKIFRDNLPGKRGDILFYFQKEIRKYGRLKEELDRYRSVLAEQPRAGLQATIDGWELKIAQKKQGITKQFLSHTAEFSGMCLFWLKNDTDFENEFIGLPS